MRTIKQLPPDVIAKIAAGEVVERPASVVKELVENALDAGARYIKIEIENAGLKKITIIDDGFGMGKEDLLECFKPHTTSKICSDEDLFKIQSLGFRGEALCSIASVSRMTIKSRPHNQPLGNQVEIQDGVEKETLPVGMPMGTEIMVENLFESTPARKKFLKKETTEFGHIVGTLTRLALAVSKIGFLLKHNGKIIFQLPAGQTLEERARLLLGERLFNQLLPVEFSAEHIHIHGLLGHPSAACSAKTKQYFFINTRHIKNGSLAAAVKDAFGTLLEARAYPAFLLFLTLPTETIDINIHPRKEEIKFLHLQSILKSTVNAIQKSLAKQDLTFKPFQDQWIMHDFSKDTHLTTTLRENTELWNVKETPKEKEILQVHNMYLVTETKHGLLVVDQHAAHEKILYQQFLETFEKEKSSPAKALGNPVVFDLPFAEAAYLHEHLEDFSKLGFDIEPFGSNSFKVTSAATIFRERNLPELISEVLDDLMQDKTIRSLDDYSHKTISYLACRSAIKAGDFLTHDERRKLIEKLSQTKTIYTCPHGRPVKLEISAQQLHLLFKRK